MLGMTLLACCMIANPILFGPGAFDGDEEFIALRTSLGFSFGHD